MLWGLLVAVLIVLGLVILKQKKSIMRISDNEIKTLVYNQMTRIDKMIVALSIKGKTVSLLALLSELEESKAEYLENDAYIKAIDNLKKDIIHKYGSHIPKDEAHIEGDDITQWSELPGCFERHLQRRYGNILFPPDRRIISKKEIEEAREKDELDKNKFIQYIKEFVSQWKKQTNLPAKEAISLSRNIQSMIEEAASIGSDLQAEVQELENIEKDVEHSLNEIMPEGSELGKKIMSYSSIKRIPFMAQLQRKDTPILKNEEVPTLLSEDLATVSFIGYVSRSFPEFKPSEADIKKHLDEAVRQGFNKQYAQEIIDAWNEEPITN